MIYVINRAAMETMQMRALRAATGGVREGRRKNAECRMKALGAAASHCKMHEILNRRSRCGKTVSRAKSDLLKRNQARCLSDRNIFFTCFTYERGSGLEENLRLSSLMFAYLRLMGKK
jgi:hypothetical protein